MLKMSDTKLLMYDEGGGEIHNVEGQMDSNENTNNERNFQTLDEPIKTTIFRDLKAVGKKFAYVMCPGEQTNLMKEWDLWGPLVLCTFIATFLQATAYNNQGNDGGPEFAEFFILFWLGSIIVTVNSKLLGGKMSLFQSVCVLGYCLLPLAIAVFICELILIAEQTNLLLFARFAITMLAFGWTTFASTRFLADSQKPNRKALAVYPIFLFYFIISWLIICHTT